MTKRKTFMSFNHLYLFLFGIVISGLLASVACSSVNSLETIKAQNATTIESDKQNSSAFDHSAYEALLKLYVDENGKVDYNGFAKDRTKLDAYLETIGTAKPSEFPSDDERNAFYINAYNSFTIRDVLDDVYGKTDSVKKVDGFWDKKKHKIGGEELTLDEIEKVSRNFKDPRVHFAVNCASSSCPRLQRFAFTGANLQEQFKTITKDFLSDEARGLTIDKAKNKVWISRIFSWYAGDFTGDTSKLGFLKGFIKSKFSASAGTNFILENGPAEIVQYIKEKNPDVGYLEYDWTLNSQIPPVKK